jgi:hypothetical protein
MTRRNPKLEGTPIFDCIPQKGSCPIGCSQCFFNRPGAYYIPLGQLPVVPTPEEVGDGIVRMNCGNDSNNQRDLVIATAQQYRNFFFNTSVPALDFPGPVVLTANQQEESPAWCPIWADQVPLNVMFIRLRVSGTNLEHIDAAVRHWTTGGLPVVLTFMAYYDRKPTVSVEVQNDIGGPDECYEWRVRHINSYYCPTKLFMRYVMSRYRDNRLVSMCGSIESSYCRACRNCETHYLQAMKRLRDE